MARRLFSALALTAVAFQGAVAGKDAEYKYDAQESVGKVVGNSTFTHPKGWYQPQEHCVHLYCVYSNQEVSHGRGLVVITTTHNVERLKGMAPTFGDSDTTGIPDPPPFHEEDVPGRGVVYVADSVIKKGTTLNSIPPVLIVHKNFFNDSTFSISEETQERLLNAAVNLLPEDTQRKFWLQATKDTGLKTIKDILLRRPFEANLGLTWQGQAAGYVDEKHYLNYPEAMPYHHHCRPNVAFHLDNRYTHRTVAVRKIQPGEELTLTYIYPFGLWAQRQELVKDWLGKPCTCSQCTGGGRGDLEEIAKSDARLEEIAAIEKKLGSPDSTGVSAGLLTRLIELYELEHLHARMSDMYGLVAIGYNNLGYEKRTVKYANMAVQAGIREGGSDHNDVLAMNILAKDPTGHYSWRQRVDKKMASRN